MPKLSAILFRTPSPTFAYYTVLPVNGNYNSFIYQKVLIGEPQTVTRIELAEEAVEFIVSTRPDPSDDVSATLADGAVLFINADGPDEFVTAQLLEPERWMVWVLREQRACALRSQAVGFT